MWTQILEQSDQGPHCLPVCKNRFEKFARIFKRRHKQMTFSYAGFLGILGVKRLTFLATFVTFDDKVGIIRNELHVL